MQVIYLNDKTEFEPLVLHKLKNQNQYGTSYRLENKLQLVTTEYSTEYYVTKGEQGKMFLCLDSNSQIGVALTKIRNGLKTQGHSFKPEKDKIYIKLTDAQATDLPRDMRMLVSVNVFGIFVQNSTQQSFLQLAVSAFKTIPLIDFDAIKNDNAVFHSLF